MSEPDDVDEFIELQGPEFAPLVAAAERAWREEPAPNGEQCGVVVHVGPTGVWTCHRQRGHDGACHAVGQVTVED